MAETRKFDPTSGENDLQRQVREALGEVVRPVEPGTKKQTGAHPDDDADQGPQVTDLDAGGSFLYYGPDGS